MNKLAVALGFAVALIGCNSKGPPVKTLAKPESIAVTRWTRKSELFMEYPPLVVGDKARFAVHLTDLGTFAPVATGRVVVRLERPGATAEAFSTDRPSRPGIFGVDVTPGTAGEFTMTVALEASGLSDTHDVGAVIVHPNAEASSKTASDTKGETISFLKEQQWTLEFATEPVAERSLSPSIRVPAEVRPRTGGEAEITAPVSGRLSSTSAIPSVGTAVARGQTLALLIPATANPADRASLEAAAAEARAALDLAHRDRERSERLLAVEAIPAKRLDEANAAEATARARREAAEARLTQHEATRRADGDATSDSAFLLRSPLSGVVAEGHATPGARVETGERLFRIVATDHVYVVGTVPEAQAALLAEIPGAELEAPGLDERLPLGRMVSVGRVVDPASRTLPVIYEAANPSGRLAVGQSVFLTLFTSVRKQAPAVPESAIVDDAGRPVIFIQVAGESFERRPVRLGNREAGYVQVLEGAKAGERVVTRGAYQIRLATLSPQIPAHGHVH